jgi:GPN-loop GTPase
MTIFGQIVIGPPGSGKTKYCSIMQEILSGIGRKCFVINLDPANDRLCYDCQINIFDLITVEDVMVNCKLGPNGGLVYCMEFLEKNIEWLIKSLKVICEKTKDAYLLFDFPGQIELYTHHNSVRNIIQKLISLDYRLCCVNLVDSYYLSDSSKFISVLLTSLSTMLQIELPHVNILSKMDLIKQYGELAFNLDFYTDVLNLSYLVETLDSDRFLTKFKKLNKKICDVVSDYSLLSFIPLNIQKKSSIIKCIQQIDRANGFIYGNYNEEDLMNSIAGDVDMELNFDYENDNDD